MMNARSASELEEDHRFICSQLWSFEDDWSSDDDVWEDYLEREERLREGLELLLSRNNSGEEGDCNYTGTAVNDSSLSWVIEQCELFEASTNKLSNKEQHEQLDRLSREVEHCLQQVTVQKTSILDTSVGLFREFEGLVKRQGNRESEEAPMKFIATVVGAIIGWVVSW